MAREYAKLKTAIWGDDDYRALPVDAQWLYEYLFSSPKIDICGVTDWHLGRIAAKAADMTPQRVQQAGVVLQARRFIVIDEATSEVLVRTFIKHDGSMKGPKTAKGVMNAWADVSSDLIRSVIAVEVVKIRDANPDWSGVREVTDHVIQKAAGYPSDTLSDPYPEGMPEVSPSERQIPIGYPIRPLSDTPSETDPILPIANSQLQPKPWGASSANGTPPGTSKRGTRLPPNFHITDDMRNWSGINTPLIDPDAETEKFIDYWTAKPGKDGTKLDWIATWRNWMRRATPARTNNPTTKTERDQAALAKQFAIARQLDAQEKP